MVPVLSTTILILVLSVASFNSVNAWGTAGHQFVADIAQSLLSNEASTFVRTHLPELNGSMSNVSTWADNILYVDTNPDYLNWQWSAQLHYVNIKDWTCVYDRQNDCNWTSTQGCVDGAIQNYTKRLADFQLDPTQRQEALKFIIHFIADVHQPLHGGFVGDRGGSTIRGNFFNRSLSLHSLWDSGMIEHKITEDYGSQRPFYLEYLIEQMNDRYAQNISDWTQCPSSDESSHLACSTTWIQEDAQLVCKFVYLDENDQQITNATGFNLSETYYNTRIDTVELRLIQAGVRLAAVINEIAKSNGTEKKAETKILVILLVAIMLLYCVS